MIVAKFRFYESSNKLETEAILANSIEEAEDYLRTIKRNGVYKIQDLNIEHSFMISEVSDVSVFSRDSEGFVSVLNWKNKNTKESGRVRLWTELPSSIENKIER